MIRLSDHNLRVSTVKLPAAMPWALAFFLLGVVTLYIAVRVLHLASQATAPLLHLNTSTFNSNIIKACPLLTEPYVPPLIWGKSGHLQTIIYGKLGRVKSPFPQGERCCLPMPDGATMTFDIFEQHVPHETHGDYTLVVCPGIANSSESLYICTCVDYAQNNGYRVAVLNHLGALKNVRLTSPRMYTYGGTDEYGAMVKTIMKRYPSTQLIAVGFSMGANIVMKYLGESKENQAKFLAGISCCQGYDATLAAHYLDSWEHMRRVYLWAMTHHQKSLLKRFERVLLGPEAQEKHGTFNKQKIFKSTRLQDLDEHYCRRRAGFDTLGEYYEWASCKNYLQNINIPVFVLNALDDPIVPEALLQIPKQFAMSRNNVIFATTRHGGHLGYFEGGLVCPETLTWLDKIVVQYSDAVINHVRAAAS